MYVILEFQVHLHLNIVNLKLPKTKETAAGHESLHSVFISLLESVHCQSNAPLPLKLEE